MQIKSILNRLQKHSAFVYETVRLVEHPRLTLEVRVRPRAGTRATCSQCRRPAPGLRHAADAALRLRAPVARPGGLPLRDAPRVLPALRRQGRGHPVGHRQAPTDRRLRLVPRRVGQAPVVAGGRRGVPHVLGHRLSGRAHGRRLGPRAPRPLEHRGHRRGRALAPPRATLPDAGLSDRQPSQASAVGRTRPQGRDAARLLRLARPRSQRGVVLRLLGHVEALPEGGRRPRPAGGARARPLPHHEPFLQSDRRSPRGGGPEARRRGQGAGAQAQPLAPAQASGASHRRAGGPALRTSCVATCGRSARICSRSTSSCYGATCRRTGRDSFSTAGVLGRCARGSTR